MNLVLMTSNKSNKVSYHLVQNKQKAVYILKSLRMIRIPQASPNAIH